MLPRTYLWINVKCHRIFIGMITLFLFQLDSPQKHKYGFTIYKLTSVVYSLKAPEAATKVVVWKRYSDFLQLYKLVKDDCKNLAISEHPPTIVKGSFFNRFDNEVIKERLQSVQGLLDFIGKHKALFLSDIIHNFCGTGYSGASDQGMGQAPISGSGIDSHSNRVWRCSDDVRWRSDASQDSSSFHSDSSDDECSLRVENTISGCSSSLSTQDNNNLRSSVYGSTKVQGTNLTNNNKLLDNASVASNECLLLSEESFEVLGGESVASPAAELNSIEVTCHSEQPIAPSDVWMTLPSAEERLLAYHVVGILDRVLLVTHKVCPNRRFILKVLRKSSWPIAPHHPVGEPRPIPHMVRLFDFIETDDAVFVIMEYACRGLLWDYASEPQERRAIPSLSDEVDTSNIDVKVLVDHAQRLLASVTRTLEQSEVATSTLNADLRGVESKLRRQGGHKPRSSSATARHRIERRYSCDDGKSHRSRTAQASLDRSVLWSRISEETVRVWGAAIVAAVDTLHSRDIIWRDLYPGNLLVGKNGNLLLSFQHNWHGVQSPLNSQAIMGLYVAPEARSVFPLTCVADWWSVGVLLYKLLTGVELVEVHPAGIGSHTTLELPEFLSAESRSLLFELLQYEPTQRLGGGINGAEDIRCHPFFVETDWDKFYRLEKDI